MVVPLILQGKKNMKKYIVALFICVPICATPEKQIRLSSVSSSLKERIQRLSLHSAQLSPEQNKVIKKAREWYNDLRDHHGNVKKRDRTATIPESVYKQIHLVLQQLEITAHLRTPQEPEKEYGETRSSRGQFTKLISLEDLQLPSYWKNAIEVTGIGVVALLIYKLFIRPTKPDVIIVNEESEPLNEDQPIEKKVVINRGE